jgi:hypothetical protein
MTDQFPHGLTFGVDWSIQVDELDSEIFALGVSKLLQLLFECCLQWSGARLNGRDAYPYNLAQRLCVGHTRSRDSTSDDIQITSWNSFRL